MAKGLRATLAEHFSLARPEIVSEQVSKDGTRKWLLRMPSTGPLDKGAEIECVYIPERDRGTLCVSSQVGCTLNCTFCHTGTQKLVRNLSAAEIVAQVIVARDRLNDYPGREPLPGAFVPNDGGRFVTNIVFAFLYMLCGPDALHGLAAPTFPKFWIRAKNSIFRCIFSCRNGHATYWLWQ